MDSKAELLQVLADPNLSSNQRAQLRCQAVRKFEDEGDYEAARFCKRPEAVEDLAINRAS